MKIPSSSALLRHVHSSRFSASLAIMLLVASAGCRPNEPRVDEQKLDGPASVQDVARALGMQVVSTSTYVVTLRNELNTITIYADPQGQAYLNGQVVGRSGGFVIADDTVYVPREVVAQLRAGMIVRQSAPTIKKVYEAPPPIDDRGPLVRLKGAKVVIDAGHGGKDPGTHDNAGRTEKSLVLAMANMVAERLRVRGVEVVMTRTTDVFVERSDRCDIANSSGARAFVSIHADWNPDPSKSGHTVIMPAAGGSEQLALAKEISSRMVASGSPQRAIRKDDRVLRVLTQIRIPNVIVELGFLSNGREAARLNDPAYQQRMADAVAEGIIAYLARR